MQSSKVCNACKVSKASDLFTTVKDRPGKTRSACRECENEKSRLRQVRRRLIPEEIEKDKEKAKNPKRKAVAKKWRLENIEKDRVLCRKYKSKNIIRLRAEKSKWVKNNPDKNAASRAKGRAAKLKATPSWLTTEHLKEIERFYRVAKILKQISKQEFHVDHIVPLQGENVCGLHVPWNLQILKATVNCGKRNKLITITTSAEYKVRADALAFIVNGEP